jgi:hypothetical protein
VVPPKGWKARKDNYKNLDFTIPHPIEQIVSGKDGYYELIYLQRESRPLTKYHKLVESFDKMTEGKTPLELEKMVSNNFNIFNVNFYKNFHPQKNFFFQPKPKLIFFWGQKKVNFFFL